MQEQTNKNCTSPANPFEGLAHVDKSDDMYDSTTDLAGDSLLARALCLLGVVCRPYWRANHLARKLQDDHRHITKWALRTATATVALAILQLPFMKAAEWFRSSLGFAEGISALLALWFVSKGIRQAVQKKWLLERHKAERYRFVKFRWILDLATKTKDDLELADWEKRAESEVEEIQRMGVADMEEWIRVNHRVTKDDASMQSVVSPEDFESILEYYRRKRLQRQITYFGDRADTTFRRDEFIRRLPSLLFLASLSIAILHLSLDLGGKGFSCLGEFLPPIKAGVQWVHEHVKWFHPAYWAEKTAVYLISFAALLPVFVAAIRTHRSANEYSRNTVRFAAIHDELKEYLPALDHPGTTRKLRILWWCEEKLENEHLEWLRLMVEAEWYG